MRRRTFIAGLGGAVTWPLCGAAQRAPVRIGFLCAGRVVVDQDEVER
jgi:hypothetical protein